jgi:hypothetical protein
MIVLIAALLASVSVRAEVFTAFKTPQGSTAPLQKDAAIWVKGYYSDVLKEKVARELRERGYKIVSDISDADVRVIVSAAVSVPQEGKAPKLYADDVYGKGVAAIPPAIRYSQLPADSSLSSPQRNPLQVNSEGVLIGNAVSSSVGQAMGVALGVNLFLSWIERRRADAERTPGVAELSIAIASADGRQDFLVISAADTAETPDALLDGAWTKAVEGLVNGVQQVEAASEKGNAK